MAKEKKTAVELETLVRHRAEVTLPNFKIRPNQTHGWQIHVYAAPNLVTAWTCKFEDLERDLRALYDLRT